MDPDKNIVCIQGNLSCQINNLIQTWNEVVGLDLKDKVTTHLLIWFKTLSLCFKIEDQRFQRMSQLVNDLQRSARTLENWVYDLEPLL